MLNIINTIMAVVLVVQINYITTPGQHKDEYLSAYIPPLPHCLSEEEMYKKVHYTIQPRGGLNGWETEEMLVMAMQFAQTPETCRFDS